MSAANIPFAAFKDCEEKFMLRHPVVADEERRLRALQDQKLAAFVPCQRLRISKKLALAGHQLAQGIGFDQQLQQLAYVAGRCVWHLLGKGLEVERGIALL